MLSPDDPPSLEAHDALTPAQQAAVFLSQYEKREGEARWGDSFAYHLGDLFRLLQDEKVDLNRDTLDELPSGSNSELIYLILLQYCVQLSASHAWEPPIVFALFHNILTEKQVIHTYASRAYQYLQDREHPHADAWTVLLYQTHLMIYDRSPGNPFDNLFGKTLPLRGQEVTLEEGRVYRNRVKELLYLFMHKLCSEPDTLHPIELPDDAPVVFPACSNLQLPLVPGAPLNPQLAGDPFGLGTTLPRIVYASALSSVVASLALCTYGLLSMIRMTPLSPWIIGGLLLLECLNVMAICQNRSPFNYFAGLLSNSIDFGRSLVQDDARVAAHTLNILLGLGAWWACCITPAAIPVCLGISLWQSWEHWSLWAGWFSLPAWLMSRLPALQVWTCLFKLTPTFQTARTAYMATLCLGCLITLITVACMTPSAVSWPAVMLALSTLHAELNLLPIGHSLIMGALRVVSFPARTAHRAIRACI